jgi:MGT family glycosyltransferase
MMARVLVYTSPARGHLFPILGPATALHARGHEVHVCTLADEVARVRALGLSAAPLAPAIEARELDDYLGRNPLEALARSVATFGDRAPHDRADLSQAIEAHRPDVLVVDNNCWGAAVAAEASGLPWCGVQPYFTPLPSVDAPPFGPGLPPAKGPLGRLRDRLLRPLVLGQLGRRTLPVVNALRAERGLAPLSTLTDTFLRAPRTIYFTAEPLEYPRRDWPASYVLVGPATWGPAAEAPAWLEAIDRPIVLVTCSTERQDDRAILEHALAGLAGEDVHVVGTSAAEDPRSFDVPANARVERFLPHGPILERAVAVVCHGGMGITQRALSAGVPVCVVPFGRDQLEVARRVEHAGAGVRLPRSALSPARLRRAVRETRARRGGAARIAEAFRASGGSERAADVIEALAADPAAGRRRTGPKASAPRA